MHYYRKNYPRPQLVRENWELLDGVWSFAFDDDLQGEVQNWQSDLCKASSCCREITVPFTYETKLSGIGDEKAHRVVWYQRSVRLQSKALMNQRLLLHFEGVDFETRVWINGKMAGTHRGGYSRFSFDITDLVCEGENRITVRVEDSFDTQQPRGKQRWLKESYGCWYVQTTGIWKSVWMEYVPETYIKNLKITPLWREKSVELLVDVELPGDSRRCNHAWNLEAEVSLEGKLIRAAGVRIFCEDDKSRRLLLDLNREDLFDWGIQQWEPEHPHLYDVELRLMEENQLVDRIGSYFGLREIRIDGGNILLNGQPIYQRLILDQGYWPESHLTPPSEEALIEDIEKIMALGYNGLRKHQKIEDERFLYWCDVKGMLVWSEMAAAYHFSDDAVEEFTKEWMDIVRQNYSHPCIITWTPFNESWGVGAVKTKKPQQHFTEAIYHLTKSLDPYRPVVVNDGWEQTVSDILTLHDYEEKGETLYRRYSRGKEAVLEAKLYHCGHHSALAEGYAYNGQPIIISEYGGIAFDQENGWGYGNKVNNEEAFLRRFDDITTAIKRLPYVCGFCYTQVSDVQQEVNGLMDEERNFKVTPERIKEINERTVEPEY